MPEKNKKMNRKEVVSWCLYDWANSAYTVAVITAFFPVFFKQYWNAGVPDVLTTARLGWGNGIAGLCVAIASPLLGAWADAAGRRKPFLAFFAVLGIVMTLLFAFVPQGGWLTALLVFVLANIGFSLGNCFYDAMLPAVASHNRLDSVSSWGYAAGYVGGGVLFAGDIFLVMNHEWFGIASKTAAVKIAFVTVALWWGLFALPIFFSVREHGTPRALHTAGMVKEILRGFARTAACIAQSKTLLFFLLGYWLYIDGVHTFIRMSADFGMSIGLRSDGLMGALLMVQFIAFPAALGFAWIAGKIGAYRSILLGIAVYVLITVLSGAFLSTVGHFYCAAAGVGIVQGGVQALSRSYFARLIPAERSAEFFGFYNLVGKFAVIIGPVLVGLVAYTFEKAGLASRAASRCSVAAIAIMFVAGGALLVAAERARSREHRMEARG